MRFFCARSLWRVSWGRFGAPDLVPGKANPLAPATFPISLGGGGYLEQYEVTTMQHLTIASREIRVIDNLYCLNDLHKASGTQRHKQPGRWASLVEAQELAREITQDTNLCLALKQVHGGANPGTYACKELVYAYAMWISPKFHLHVIRAFDAMQQAPRQLSLPEPEAALPPDIQKALDERIGYYTGQSHIMIREKLTLYARECLERRSPRSALELFENWTAKTKTVLMLKGDIDHFRGLSKFMAEELHKFNKEIERM